MRTGVAWLGIAFAGWTIAGCGRKELATAARDAGPPADASVPVDATWRTQDMIGFVADILPLLERDCPASTPPRDPTTRIGRRAGPGGWDCSTTFRPGLRQIREAGFPGAVPTLVRHFTVGYEWDANKSVSSWCDEGANEVLYEYFATVVKSPDGVPPTEEDLRRVTQHLAFGGDRVLLLSTGPIQLSYTVSRYETSPDLGYCYWRVDANMEGTRFQLDAGTGP